MKKKHLCLVLTLIFALLLGGCASGETADKYVGDLITSIKKEDPSSLSSFLEQGISDENETYVLQFPDELKDSYLKFLQASFNAVEFEINGAKKIDDERYSVQLTFTPLDIEATTKTLAKNIVRPSFFYDLMPRRQSFSKKHGSCKKLSFLRELHSAYTGG